MDNINFDEIYQIGLIFGSVLFLFYIFSHQRKSDLLIALFLFASGYGVVAGCKMFYASIFLNKWIINSKPYPPTHYDRVSLIIAGIVICWMTFPVIIRTLSAKKTRTK